MANTYYYNGSGSADWNASGVWGTTDGGTPGTSWPGESTTTDNVVIASGTVNLTAALANPIASLQINNGATLDLGTATQAVILQVGNSLTQEGTITNNGTISGSGTLEGQSNAVLVVGSGTVDVTGNLTVVGTVNYQATSASDDMIFNISNASTTLTFDQRVGDKAVAQTVNFAPGASGTESLVLETNTSTSNLIVNNFVVGDKIIVPGGSSIKASGNDIIVTRTGFSVTIDVGSAAAAADASYKASGSTDVITTTAICFMPGTRIRVPGGDVAVETLKPGDLVLTKDGVAKPVTWLGRQTISKRFADPMHAWPVRVKAGAIAENVPSRDLVLSPSHALFIDGVMVLASALVNGSSVVRETDVPDTFTYYHVELDDHSLILAENTPAETFVDNVDRLAFDNWNEHLALYPEGKSVTPLPYPTAKSFRQVPMNVRVKLAERANILGAAAAAVA